MVYVDVQEGTAALNLYVQEEYHRASRGGAGGIKAITNYSPVIKISLYTNHIYICYLSNKYVEILTAIWLEEDLFL